jgi:hypothetical protein
MMATMKDTRICGLRWHNKGRERVKKTFGASIIEKIFGTNVRVQCTQYICITRERKIKMNDDITHRNRL